MKSGDNGASAGIPIGAGTSIPGGMKIPRKMVCPAGYEMVGAVNGATGANPSGITTGPGSLSPGCKVKGGAKKGRGPGGTNPAGMITTDERGTLTGSVVESKDIVAEGL